MWLTVGRVSTHSQHFFLFYRKSSEELDMDKVTAAMVLTSLSTSPLVRSPPVRPNGKPRVCALGKSKVSPGALISNQVKWGKWRPWTTDLILLRPQHSQVLTWAAHIF